MNTQKYPDAPDGSLISIEVAAERLGVSKTSVRRAVSRGDLRVVRIGRRVLFDPRELRRLIAESMGRSQ